MRQNTMVVNHLNYPRLRKTLESIRKHTPPNFYLVLVDQNLTYQPVDDLVDLHLYTNGVNVGFGMGMNLGMRLTDTPFVSAWNDDCECINKKWWDGVMKTFEKYKTALGVNPSSPRNPRAAGEEPINHPGWEYKEEFTEEEYDRMVAEIGKGHVIDGICTFATVFDREKLNKVAGTIPNRCFYDEYYYPGGGEDYDLNRRGYLTKNVENEHKGYRMLGTGLSFVWHWWYSTQDPKSGKCAVKHCGTSFHDKWGVGADIYGRVGNQLVPYNKLRELDQCRNLKKE